jgi:DNA-binding LacI/PurR family transcriptional regulator
VPEDISVVGADDAAEAEAAGLTTVRVPWLDMARLATESLLAIISVRGVRRLSIVLEPTLVIRTSTAPPVAAPCTDHQPQVTGP